MTIHTAVVAYSTDYGATFTGTSTVGVSPGSVGALDLERSGSVSIASATGQVKMATTLGGGYNDAPGGTFAAVNPVSLVLPYFAWGYTDTAHKQTGSATPDYATLLDAVSGGGTLKRITGAGSVTDITPVSGFIGYCANAITTLYGDRMAVLGSVSGDRRVYVTSNAGAGSPTWTLAKSGLSSHALFLRVRRDDSRLTGGQLFLVDGDKMWYSRDFGANFYARTMPVADIEMCDILG
jgi:hypothetical protein